MGPSFTAQRWWPLALSEELLPGVPVSVRRGQVEIVLFRDHQGRVQALEDRCAHRRAPLSLGRVTPEGWLQCAYHGWCYDGASGRCAAIPNLGTNERVPPTYAVKRYASLECDGFIYVYDGSPEAAEQAALPFSDLTEQPQFGSMLMTLPHQTFIAALLDGPWLILDLGKVTIVPDHRLGDPWQHENLLFTQFVADWTPSFRRRSQMLPDYPLLLCITVAAVTGMSRIELLNAQDEPLLNATISANPWHAAVTAVHWRSRITPVGTQGRYQPSFSMPTHPAAAGLLSISNLGFDAWSSISDEQTNPAAC